MEYLENDCLKIKINELGAELAGVTGKKENTEFLWSGDAKYWAGRAPVLFPIVGSVKNNEYTIDGKKYILNRHGFARKSIFDITKVQGRSITYELKYNEDTLKSYPYKFSLEIIYTLEGNTLTNTYRVKNLDSKAIYFGIGGHPAFSCPINEGEAFSDCYLEFNKTENAGVMALNEEGLFSGETYGLLNNTNILDLHHDLFKHDALVFERLESDMVALKSKKSDKSVEFYFDGFLSLGVWTVPGANYVCLEPWVTFADTVNSTGDLRGKQDIIKLDSGEFSVSFKMAFYE
ncbi:MAG: aldose 1-epimerase family protein [Clostridiales bacterium]|jgi:galactose mutarotase-like enzyme|nr:aldose 1-epimerase family protein [Clostridiales bacterium]